MKVNIKINKHKKADLLRFKNTLLFFKQGVYIFKYHNLKFETRRVKSMFGRYHDIEYLVSADIIGYSNVGKSLGTMFDDGTLYRLLFENSISMMRSNWNDVKTQLKAFGFTINRELIENLKLKND
jgi:hypothetical protein